MFPPLVPDPLPDMLLPEPVQEAVTISSESTQLVPGPTFDASRTPSPQREQFHRNLRSVSQVLAGATQTSVAEKEGLPRSTLGRLVRRTRQLGQIACAPHGSYRRQTTLHPAFQDCIRRLFLLPTRLSMTAIREHTEMQQVAARFSKDSGKPVKLPSYKQARTEVDRLKIVQSIVCAGLGNSALGSCQDATRALRIQSSSLCHIVHKCESCPSSYRSTLAI
jgi:hypothetical protein